MRSFKYILLAFLSWLISYYSFSPAIGSGFKLAALILDIFLLVAFITRDYVIQKPMTARPNLLTSLAITAFFALTALFSVLSWLN